MGPDGPREEDIMREAREQRLYDLTHDMDCIGGDDEIWEQIHSLSNEDLEELIKEQEELLEA